MAKKRRPLFARVPSLAEKPHKPKRQKRVPKPKYVVVRVPGGVVRHYGASYVRHRQGVRKGAETIQRLGLAHRWTSETARAAANKVWATRWRMNKRIGTRIGRRRKNMKAVDRKALREQYAHTPTHGVTYIPSMYFMGHPLFKGRWELTTPEGDTRVLSERAALTRLGHLRSQHGYVPTDVVGMTDAVVPDPKETS